MHLKRFRANSVREALAHAKAALGPDALVLSTRLVPSGGWRGLAGRRDVELTAAIEREVSADRTGRQETRSASGLDDPAVARLCAAGVEASFAREVVAGLPAGARRKPTPEALRTALARRLSPLAAPRAAATPVPRVEVFVGPPGAGKTTTIAKIAAQRLVETGRSPRLVSADGFRVGAIEQLRLYAEIIGAPFAAARTPGELADVLSAPGGEVLVDTAGRSPRDREASDMFEALGGVQGLRTHLVLPAGTTRQAAARLFDLNAAARATHVVLTRTDESPLHADLVSAVAGHGCHVSYVGTGQRVPEDLCCATPAVLVDAMLGDGLAEAWSAA